MVLIISSILTLLVQNFVRMELLICHGKGEELHTVKGKVITIRQINKNRGELLRNSSQILKTKQVDNSKHQDQTINFSSWSPITSSYPV